MPLARRFYGTAGVNPVSAADTQLSPRTCHRLGPSPGRLSRGWSPSRKEDHDMRVLIVEDFEVLARSIGTGLRREGMAVDVVLDGDDALSHLAGTRYDVVVLDRDLPGTHGDDVCRDIVAERESRILML